MTLFAIVHLKTVKQTHNLIRAVANMKNVGKQLIVQVTLKQLYANRYNHKMFQERLNLGC